MGKSKTYWCTFLTCTIIYLYLLSSCTSQTVNENIPKLVKRQGCIAMAIQYYYFQPGREEPIGRTILQKQCRCTFVDSKGKQYWSVDGLDQSLCQTEYDNWMKKELEKPHGTL